MHTALRPEGSRIAESRTVRIPSRSKPAGKYLCINDYELTQPTKAGARESTRADLIEERSQFPQRPTDVATGAPRSGH